MAKLNVKSLNRKIEKLIKQSKAKDNVEATVGFSAAHALVVHEDLTARHPNGGQAKYLEQPARTEAKEIARIIREARVAKRTTKQAITLGALHLQRESQLLVPVDTAELKNSAFVEVK